MDSFISKYNPKKKKYEDSDSDSEKEEEKSSLRQMKVLSDKYNNIEKAFEKKMIKIENRITNLEIELFTMLKDMVNVVEEEAKRNRKASELKAEPKEEPKEESKDESQNADLSQ